MPASHGDRPQVPRSRPPQVAPLRRPARATRPSGCAAGAAGGSGGPWRAGPDRAPEQAPPLLDEVVLHVDDHQRRPRRVDADLVLNGVVGDLDVHLVCRAPGAPTNPRVPDPKRRLAALRATARRSLSVGPGTDNLPGSKPDTVAMSRALSHLTALGTQPRRRGLMPAQESRPTRGGAPRIRHTRARGAVAT